MSARRCHAADTRSIWEDLRREKLGLELRKLDVKSIKLQRDMRHEGWRVIITAISVAIGVFGFCFAVLRSVMEPLARG